MSAGGMNVARATSMMERLVRHADDICDRKVPMLFGRGSAIERLERDALALADQARSVEAEFASSALSQTGMGDIGAKLVRASATQLRETFARVPELGVTALTRPPITDAVDQARQAVELLGRRSQAILKPTTSGQATAQLESLLDRASHAPTRDEVVQIAELLTRPGQGAPRLPAGIDRADRIARTLEIGWQPDRQGSLLFTEPLDEIAQGFERDRILATSALTREVLAGELTQLVAKARGTLSQRDLRRLGAISTLPAERRPYVPPPHIEAWPMHRWTNHPVHKRSNDQAHAFARRVLQQRQTLLDDPTITKASVEQEWRRIIAKPDAEITQQDWERIGILSTLPDEVRPFVPEPYGGPFNSILHQAHRSELPSTNQSAAQELDNLRVTLDRDRLAADPSVTRAGVEAELRRRFGPGVEQLTRDDLRYVGLVASLPEQLRPAVDVDGIRLLLRLGKDPRTDVRAAAVLERMRGDLAASSPTVVEDSAALIAAGVDPGPAVRKVLLELPPERLAAGGLDLERLMQIALPKLERREDLSTFRRVVDMLGAGHSPQEQQLLDEAVRLLDLSDAQMRGTVTGGYRGHPDYANLGRARANLDLVMTLRRAQALEQAPATTVGANMLRW